MGDADAIHDATNELWAKHEARFTSAWARVREIIRADRFTYRNDTSPWHADPVRAAIDEAAYAIAEHTWDDSPAHIRARFGEHSHPSHLMGHRDHLIYDEIEYRKTLDAFASGLTHYQSANGIIWNEVTPRDPMPRPTVGVYTWPKMIGPFVGTGLRRALGLDRTWAERHRAELVAVGVGLLGVALRVGVGDWLWWNVWVLRVERGAELVWRTWPW